MDRRLRLIARGKRKPEGGKWTPIWVKAKGNCSENRGKGKGSKKETSAYCTAAEKGSASERVESSTGCCSERQALAGKKGSASSSSSTVKEKKGGRWNKPKPRDVKVRLERGQGNRGSSLPSPTY